MTATTVLGLVCFGVLHNVLELRYVTGRFATVLSGPFLWLLAGLVTGIVVCRLLGQRIPKILLAYAVLAASVLYALRKARWRVAALAALGAALTASLTWPAYHFVLLAHLHNVVPPFFLWEWSRRLDTGRMAFRLVQVGWVLAIPALVLVGVFNRLVAAGPSTVVAFAGSPAAIAGPVTPPNPGHRPSRVRVCVRVVLPNPPVLDQGAADAAHRGAPQPPLRSLRAPARSGLRPRGPGKPRGSARRPHPEAGSSHRATYGRTGNGVPPAGASAPGGSATSTAYGMADRQRLMLIGWEEQLGQSR